MVHQSAPGPSHPPPSVLNPHGANVRGQPQKFLKISEEGQKKVGPPGAETEILLLLGEGQSCRTVSDPGRLSKSGIWWVASPLNKIVPPGQGLTGFGIAWIPRPNSSGCPSRRSFPCHGHRHRADHLPDSAGRLQLFANHVLTRPASAKDQE